MPRTHIIRETPVKKSARLAQVASMFDMPVEGKSRMEWDVNLPIEDKPWNIGLVVGPSGCGKSTVLKELFPGETAGRFTWPHDRSVVEAFPAKMPIREVIEFMSSVGFSSPPSWLRPFHVLSNGEQFRVTIARALAEAEDTVVVDEFTSVVDRQVAKIASHAIQRTIRRRKLKFIAAACHYDIIEWLQPDWVYQPHLSEFQWRELQRHPDLRLDIHPLDRSAWKAFRQHHYLSADLHVAAKCLGAFLDGECVAFAAYRFFPHPHTRNIMMGHRTVVLPDYQGLGIGGRLDDFIGQMLWEQSYRYRNVVAHPAMIAYYSKSPRWKLIHRGMNLNSAKTARPQLRRQQSDPRRLNTFSFEYTPPKQ